MGALIFLAACGGNLSIAGAEVAADTQSLDLNGAGITSVSKLKRLKSLTQLDLRNNEISIAEYLELKEALPNCDVLWSVPINGRRVDSDATEITDPDISIKSAEALQYLPKLKTIDATGNENYALLKELAASYPQYQFHWSVTLDQQSWANTERAIEVVADRLDDAKLVKAILGFLQLEQVDLSRAGATKEQVERLQKEFPQIGFASGLSIAGKSFDSNATSIDLSDDAAVTFAELAASLMKLHQIESVNLRGCNLTIAERQALLTAYPDIQFLWTVELLPGIVVDSADKEIVLSDNPVTDLQDLKTKLALLPSLTSVEMCNCKLDNEQMQSLRDLFPAIKFIWLVRVGDWELRTDIQAFSLANVKPFPGGKLVGEEFWRYHNFTADSLVNLKYCTDLIALDIGHASNVKELSNLASLTKLKFLIVAMTRDTDIEVIRNMPDLVFLEIFSMPITDLSPLLSCTKLEYLNCGNCKFKGIDELVQMKQLKRLWIIDSKLTVEQLSELKAALPDTLVRIKGEHPTDNGWRRDNPRYVEMRKLFHLG
jgi:Leucine-rich repeat (LRR) protein